MPTLPAQRLDATPQEFGIPTVVLTITLADPPVGRIAMIAMDTLDSPEREAVVGIYGLYLMQKHDALISILTQSPIDAEFIEQSFVDQNTIMVRVQADRTSQIAALPGVLSTREGANPPPLREATPSRDTYQPGTRMPPIQPPGYNEGS